MKQSSPVTARAARSVCNQATVAATYAVHSEIVYFVVTHDVTEEAMPWLARAKEVNSRLAHQFEIEVIA